jgi:uncharacterized membrane protein
MKKLMITLCLLSLASWTGCSEAERDGQDAAQPAAEGSSTETTPTVAKKPMIGEAEGSFSLSLPFESIEVIQGEETSVRIGINRGENFAEQVRIKVSDLPKGVTVDTSEEPVITQGSTGVELKLVAANDAALGDFTAKVTGHTASSSVDFSEEIKFTVSQK